MYEVKLKSAALNFTSGIFRNQGRWYFQYLEWINTPYTSHQAFSFVFTTRQNSTIITLFVSNT